MLTGLGKKPAGMDISRAGLVSIKYSSVPEYMLHDNSLIRSGQPAFRVRSDFAAGLNSDQGWAGVINENVTIYSGQPFRIRFEIAMNRYDEVVLSNR